MVCFVDVANANPAGEKMTEKVIDMTRDDDEELTLQRLAGGSVIEYPPVFSPNGDILFIIWDTNIRAYSTSTGEWVRELEGIKEKKIVGQQWDPENPKLLYGCTDDGNIISWKWESGVVNEKKTLRFMFGSNARVESFALIPMNDKRAHGLISWRAGDSPNVQIGIFDLANGIRVECKFPMNLNSSPVKFSVSQSGLHYFALIQDNMLWCVDYQRGRAKPWKNIKGIPLSCVACHPTEEQVATGDVSGRILLYRKIFNNGEPMTTLYAWHHTTVNTIGFTVSGVQFYSGGMENTLVRWNIKDPKIRDYLPRMLGTPLHVCVGADNQKVAVSADDNGIQILNAQLHPKTIIQNFTWVPNDKTNVPKFPIGLKVNPRNSSLVLNGRVGHLQFFSTHTKSLLYNLDTAGQNRLNIETDRILYNTYVSHAALNMDWLATAEVLDDQVHTLESRLKFWRFDTEKQIFVLNTQVELPHENGVRALEFSTPYSMENLLCASSGELDVKLWTLEDIERVETKGKMWTCIGRVSYKNLPIKSIAFSSDTSLLSIGFGNTLCVYTSETLRLKCALSAPPASDGSTSRLTITLPTNKHTDTKDNLQKSRANFLARRKQMNELVRKLLETNDSTVFLKSDKKPGKVKRKRCAQRDALSLSDQGMLFDQIMASNGMNLFQKINLFERFNLHVRVPQKKQKALTAYCYENSIESISANLLRRVLHLAPRHRFAYSHKYAQLQRQHLGSNNLVNSFNRLFNFGQKPTPTLSNGTAKSKRERKRTISSSSQDTATHITSDPVQPALLKTTTQVNHVAFCMGEYAHLVIVCTDTRLLIWNLLTLRLQSSYKLAVDKITIDMYTSLVAVITQKHDLYVFLPGTPLPLYQRRIEPHIHGIAWIPRRFPKARSLTIDWQASSELYFLSKKQELLRLVSSNDMESFNTTASYLSDNLQPLPYTPFAAMLAKQQQNYASGSDLDNRSNDTYSIGVLGKNSVKELTGLQTHTMAPVSLLCNRFLKSLLIDEEKLAAQQNNANDSDAEADDDDDVHMHSDDDD